MFLHLANAMIQKSIIFHDPWYFLRVIGNTFWLKQESFIQSTVGILGWLDTPLPAFFYYGFAVLFGMVIVTVIKNKRQRTPIGLVILLSCIFIGTIASIMYHFYIYGTPVAYPMVDSLQGRYLLPVLPFFIMTIFFWAEIAFRHKKIVFVFLATILLCVSVQQIISRYYDYSRVFDTFELLLAQEKDLQDNKEHNSMLIEDTQSFIYEVKYPEYKIGGFQLLIDVDVTQPVTVPYRFELKDAQCKNSIRSGYLDQTELHRPHIYTQLLPITPLLEEKVCLTLVSLFGSPGMQFLSVVTQDNKPIVNFLYLKK